jgi:hypothetical protein
MEEFSHLSRDRGRDKVGRGREPGMVLTTGNGSYRIVEMRPDGCLIEAPGRVALRGFADIYRGDEQVASCLIVVARPDGDHWRCAFKRLTAARATPPADFVG